MKRLLKVTSMTALLTLLKMLSGFVIAKIVAIYTGPSGLAVLGQIQSVVASLNGLVNAPVGSGVVRYTAENSSQGFKACSPWWSASIRWVVFILCIIVPSGLLLANQLSIWLFQSTEYYWIIVVTVLMLPITAMGTLVVSIINGQQLYKRYVAVGMVSVIVSTIIMVSFIIVNNLNGALLATSMQAGLIGIVMILFSWRQPWFKLEYFLGKCSQEHKKKIGGYVLMALTSALTVPVALIFVRKIIIAYVGIYEAGQWQAVWKISEVYLGVITMALATYYLPKLASAKNAVEIKHTIWQTMKVIVPVVTMLAICVYILRDIAITLLFTEDFRSARDLFSIQLVGDIIKIISWIIAYPIISKGKVFLFILTELYFSVQLVLLTFFLVPEYNVQGANIAYALNYIIYTVFVWVLIYNIKL